MPTSRAFCRIFSLLCCLAGSAFAADPAGTDRGAFDKYLGKGVVGESITAPAIDDPGAYYALKPATLVYRILNDGEPQSQPTTETIAKLAQPENDSTWKREMGPLGANYVAVDPDGSLRRMTHFDPHEKVVSHFTPGEFILSANMKAGDKRTAEIAVNVTPTNKPKDITYHGKLAATLTYVGAFKVTTPAGTFDAVLMKETYKGSVGPAEIDIENFMFYAKGVGEVASIQEKQVSAVIVYNTDTKTGKLLAKRP